MAAATGVVVVTPVTPFPLPGAPVPRVILPPGIAILEIFLPRQISRYRLHKKVEEKM